jgi:virginiamycin A acetyltransferase
MNKILKLMVMLFYRSDRTALQKFAISICTKLEGGECFSSTLRQIFYTFHRVEIGMYSHGGCFVKYGFSPYTRIGRYCSIARSARAFNRNHPMHFKSTHALFYDPIFGICPDDPIPYVHLTIGNDVWIGHNAIIMPMVTSIGDGAVVAAGAVVSRNVPNYAIMVGNPARIVRYRFDEGTIKSLLLEKWWENDIGALNYNDIRNFYKQYE